jgi:hypothetical protein
VTFTSLACELVEFSKPRGLAQQRIEPRRLTVRPTEPTPTAAMSTSASPKLLDDTLPTVEMQQTQTADAATAVPLRCA